MKREAYRHPKMFDLASRLGVALPHAVGILDMLLDYAADYAPQGNIGKVSNVAIAGACMWTSDPDDLVSALVASGWLDQSTKYRLVIHDLAEHAQSWWKAKLQKLGLEFLSADSEGSEKALRTKSEGFDRHIPEPGTGYPEPDTRNLKTRKPAGVFADVDEATLRDTGKLLLWHARAVAEGKLSGSESVRLNVMSAAERACDAGKKPAALFVDIVKGGKWNLISAAQEARAQQRLKDYERATGPPPNGRLNATKELADSFSPKE